MQSSEIAFCWDKKLAKRDWETSKEAQKRFLRKAGYREGKAEAWPNNLKRIWKNMTNNVGDVKGGQAMTARRSRKDLGGHGAR